jgi:multiple sugar transport system ATP-binding protein
MGSDSLVWVNVGGQMLSARVESSVRFNPGDKVTVRFRVGLSSLFDAASGDRL